MSYAWTSETRACKKCGKPLPLSAECNTMYCKDCLHENRLETWRKARRKSYHKHRDKIIKEKREEYKWYKERGICVDCHARDAAVLPDGTRMTRCTECMTRFKELRRRKKEKA